MHAAVRGVLVVLLLGTAPRVDAQTSEPLRKTDLIRLLSGGALSHREIADLIGRNCVSFTPTTRDRIDLAALGAYSLMRGRLATCRRSQAARPAAPPPPASPAAAVVVPLQSRVTVEAGSEVVVAVAVRQGAQPAPGVRLVLRGSGGMSGTVGAGPDAVAGTDARGIAPFRGRAAAAPITRSPSVQAPGRAMLTRPAGGGVTARRRDNGDRDARRDRPPGDVLPSAGSGRATPGAARAGYGDAPSRARSRRGVESAGDPHRCVW